VKGRIIVTDWSKYAKPRSVRVEDDLWTQAGERAKAEGTNLSAVVNLLLQGYASQNLDLPRVELVWDRAADVAHR
jgi:hypothetical protein